MPVMGSGGVGFKNASTSLVDSSGQTTTVSADRLPGTVTEAQVTTYQTCIGNLSNAGIFKQTYSGSTEKSKTEVTAFDEAESSVTKGANFTFQNRLTLATRIFRVPAIDADAINEAGTHAEVAKDGAGAYINDQVGDFIDAVLAMLGTDWRFTTAPITTQGRGGAPSRVKPIIAEPGSGALPPDAPAV